MNVCVCVVFDLTQLFCQYSKCLKSCLNVFWSGCECLKPNRERSKYFHSRKRPKKRNERKFM